MRWFDGGRCRPRDRLGGLPPPADGVDVERGAGLGLDHEGEAQNMTGQGFGPCCHGLERVGRGKAELALTEADQSERDFVDAVDPHQGGHGCVGKPCEHLGGHAVGVGGRQQVGQHRAGIPPQVPPPPFPVLPTGPEGDARQHKGHVVAHVHRSTQRYQGVVEGVVVVDVVIHDVHLDRVQVAGRHRGPEPDRTTVGRAGDPGDTGGKEQQRAEQSLVEQFELGAAARQHFGSRQR